MDIDEALSQTILGKKADERRAAIRRAVRDDAAAALGACRSAHIVAPEPPRGFSAISVAFVSDRGVLIATASKKGDDCRFIPSHDIAAVTTAPGFGVLVRVTITTPYDTIALQVLNEVVDAFTSALAPLVSQAASDVTPWWRSPTIRYPRAPLRLDYIGGLPGADRERNDVLARFDIDGVHLTAPGALLRWEHHIGWDQVTELAIEGFDSVQRRMTVTRLLAVGVFAFAWRKRQRSAFVVLDLGSGEVILASKLKDSRQLRAELGTIVSASESRREPASATAGAAPPVAVDAASRLRQVEDLLAAGLITKEEFEAKRQEIIASL